jgi:hypothetical protein
MSPDVCAKELARLLTAQAEICRQILEKSQLQQKLVEERREDELLSLLTEKQRLIEKHQALSAQAKPFLAEWEASARDMAAPDAHARVERAWNELREVLDAIVKLEDASRAMLQDHKGQVSMDIGKIQKGRIVNKAYGGALRPPPAARFSDRQG